MDCRFINYRPYSYKDYKEGLDRYEGFLSAAQHGRIDIWSARKTFHLDDLAIFHFAQPLMTIAANNPANNDNRAFFTAKLFQPTATIPTQPASAIITPTTAKAKSPTPLTSRILLTAEKHIILFGKD